MQLVDVHCHLEDERLYGRLDAVLRDARSAGVAKLLTCAVSPEQWPVSAEMPRCRPEIAFAWGIHPWFVKPEHSTALGRLREAREAGAKAIGEIGLDSKIEAPSMAMQTEFFEAQLGIANELELPVVIHCRGAFNELLASLRRIGTPSAGGMVHAFSGSAQLARDFAKLGLKFSLGRSLTYKRSKKREELMQFIYPDHFLLETDSPDMPPVGADPDTPNEPKNLVLNLRGAAALVGQREEDIARITTRNACALFGFEV